MLVLAMAAALVTAGGLRGASGDVIVTAAGNGTTGSGGDGGPAAQASVDQPNAVAGLPDGGYLVSQFVGSRVRRVFPDGTIRTVVGTGAPGYTGDGGPADKAQVVLARGVAPLPGGGFLVADRDAGVIRTVDARGIIHTVAGTGVQGYGGDGGPATAAQLNIPYAATPTPDGGFLIADRGNHRIRKVSRDGIITTVAGTGAGGFSGDGGPAIQAQINAPCVVMALADGSFLFPDRDNHRVRRVDPNGIITTVAGNGIGGASGDGGPATQAEMKAPYALAPTGDGGFYIADRDDHRIRRVGRDGIITTVAGTGSAGLSGDGGPGVLAQVSSPTGLGLAVDGTLLIADTGNSRIRRLRVTQPAAGGDAAGGASPGAFATIRLVPAGRRVVRARAGHLVHLRLVASYVTRLRVRVARGTTVTRRVTVTTRVGSNVVAFYAPPRAGRYVLRILGATGPAVLAKVTLLVIP